MNKSDKNSIASLQSCNETKSLEIDKEYEASASSMAEEIDEVDTTNYHPYLHHYRNNNQHIPFFKKDKNSDNSSTDSSVPPNKDRYQKLLQQREKNQPSSLHMTTTEPEEVLTPNSGYEGDTEGPPVEDEGRF